MNRFERNIATVLLLLMSTVAIAATHHVPGTYVTIQEAVNVAVPGDTIAIAAGIYTEQVVIVTDQLTILGAGPELTIIHAPLKMEHGVGGNEVRAVVSVELPAETVTIRDLAIDGLGHNPEAGRFAGLLLYRVGGLVENVTVANIHDTPVSSSNSGIGIFCTNDISMPQIPLTLRTIRSTRFQKAGVVVSGPYQADISDLEIATDGIYSDSVQIGMELSFTNGAIVRDCEISDVTYDGDPYPTYTAAGILGYYSGFIDASHVKLARCQSGVYFARTQGDLSYLDIEAEPVVSTYNHGLVVVGAIVAGAASAGEPAWQIPLPVTQLEEPSARPPDQWYVRLRDSVLDGRGLQSSRGIGLLAVTAEPLNFTAERCLLEKWETGIMSLEYGIGGVFGRMSGCRFEGNASFGAYANTIAPLDARGCWWDSATGPYHPSLNPFGLGDTVSDDVLFGPWVVGNLAALPMPQVISLGDFDGEAYTDTVVIEYLGGGAAPLYGYSMSLEWNPEIVDVLEVTRPTGGDFADATFFQTLGGNGQLTIDAALGGDAEGIESGTLANILLAAVGTPDHKETPLTLTLHHGRDRYNQNLVGLEMDSGFVTVDLQPPVFESLTLRNETLQHTDQYAKNGDLLSVISRISDGDPAFGAAGIRGTGAAIFGVDDVFYSPPDIYVAEQAFWIARPAVLTPADGTAMFWVEAWDPSGNVMAQEMTSLTADNTPPAPVTGLTVDAGHNTLNLTWDVATGHDLNYRHTLVRTNAWQDYPWYDGPTPPYPTAADEGESWYLGDGGALDRLYAPDGSERDLFFISALVEDMAGNVSAIDAGNSAAVINYILGDVRGPLATDPPDGVITIHDIDRLGGTYDLDRGDPGFDGPCDIAPLASDPPGLPQPDETIGFDDLMVMAMVFDPIEEPAPAPPSGDGPLLSWQRVSDLVWSLTLEAPCPQLKGLRLTGVAPPNAGIQLLPGTLLAEQPAPYFLHPGGGGFAADLAILGRGWGVTGTGELLRLVVDQPVILPAPLVDLRDLNNEPLTPAVPLAVGGGDMLPTVFRAGYPHPNPFNPSTRIAFDLPQGALVHMAVYGLDGRCVATLVDEVLPAGQHLAQWHGQDDGGRPVAAGTYLYRLTADSWLATGKLNLVK